MADIIFPANVAGAPSVRPLLVATAGGQGSFSYLDTKVYGPRQQRQAYSAYRLAWNYSLEYYQPPLQEGQSHILENYPMGKPPQLILPGTGGSAKAPGKRYFGSRAIGFNPNGLVLIRLIKV